MNQIDNNSKSLRLFVRYSKVLSLAVWTLPIYIYCKWLMVPFAKANQNMIGLNNDLFIKYVGFSKYDIYLTVFPSMFYIIIIFVVFRNALNYIETEKNLSKSKRFDIVILYHHLILLLGFALVLFCYYLGINKFITNF
ncbi:hypothetical protein ABH307_00525 [Acinetobacter pittii]|uniref:hypothetical protein n=1 Tax=Acinetobacter pittii TaxID=48296 RepID=UPI0032619CE4